MNVNNILIIKLSAIGDVIHALPVSYAIKETYPGAHDLRAAVAEAPGHTVVVRAGGGGDGNFAAFHGNRVFSAAVAGDGEGLVKAQIHGFYQGSLTADLGVGGRSAGTHQKQAQPQTKGQQGRQQNGPGFGFHAKIPPGEG